MECRQLISARAFRDTKLAESQRKAVTLDDTSQGERGNMARLSVSNVPNEAPQRSLSTQQGLLSPNSP